MLINKRGLTHKIRIEITDTNPRLVIMNIIITVLLLAVNSLFCSADETIKMSKGILPDVSNVIVLTDQENELVSKGYIIVLKINTTEVGGRTFEAVVIINASIKTVLQVLTEYEKNQGFLSLVFFVFFWLMNIDIIQKIMYV